MRFDPRELEARVPGVVYCNETGSTNKVARGLEVGTVVVADHHRVERSWQFAEQAP